MKIGNAVEATTKSLCRRGVERTQFARLSLSVMFLLGVLFSSSALALSVSFNPSVVNLSVGEKALVEVVVADLPSPGLAAFQFKLNFDPTSINIVNPNEAFRGSGIPPFAPLQGNAFCTFIRGTATCLDPNWFITDTGRIPDGVIDTIDNTGGSISFSASTRADASVPSSSTLPVGGGVIAIIEVVGNANGWVIVSLPTADLILADATPVQYPGVTTSTLTVNVGGVVSNAAPVITLNGVDPVFVAEGATYTDAGATASDVEDGDLTASIVTNNPVNTTIPGSYTVTYNVTDSGAIAATQVTRTVTVVGNAAPVISLLGASPVSVSEGATHSDAGATASDAEDGDLSASIVINNPVDTTVPGAYLVTYDVMDSGGKSALQVTRTVNVIANAVPVISLLGTTPVTVTEGAAYADAGATASDTEDGDLSASIVVNNPVDTATPGTYTVTYNVVDSGGKSALQVSRTVNVTANAAPVITLLGLSPVSVTEGAVYTDAGATASDVEDGDLTPSIAVVNPVDTSLPGTYVVTYNVTDSGGKSAAQVSRTINVIGNAAPVITLLGVSPVSVTEGATYTDAGATASDAEDGNLSASIVVVNPVDTTVPGAYTVTYDVADTDGKSAVQVTRMVNVVANAAPVISLLGAATINVTEGATYSDAGATASDAEDGDLTASIVTNNPVDTSVPGSYTVTYDVTDSGGKTALQVTRIVTVIANNAPVITLFGADPISITEGASYIDAGATASDVEDGNLTGSIVVVNPVDTSVPGAYTVTYDVTDADGKSAIQVTRIVNVIFNNVPVITLFGADPISITEGASYIDAGATATDLEDGNLTASIITVNPVDTAISGTYTVTYDVTDADGKSAVQVTRTVNVIANAAPVISLLGTTPVNVTEGAAYTDAGATASDAEDGDLTASLVTNNPVDTSVPGTYTVTYNVADADGKSAVQVTRTVNVIGNNAPVISLLGDSPVNVTEGATYSDAGATANDAEDGDLTASIVINNPVDTSVPGTYTITYDVTDADGKSAMQVTRTVNVVANNAPVISLFGVSPVNVTEGASYIDAGATASDTEDGNLTASIVVVNPVDTSIPGTYIVTYDVTDTDGKAAVQVTRTVNVVGNNAPVISLLGASSVNVTEGATYTDAGATANDAEDGDLTASIATNNPVDTLVPGTYTVTYDVTDADGKSAAQVTRTVNVIGNAAPVISLLGITPINIAEGVTYADAGATASDTEDGDLTVSIVINNPVDTTLPGTYIVTYDVTDNDGKLAVQVTRTVNVVANAAPVISLLGTTPVNIVEGATYVDAGATASDAEDGDLTASLVINNPVNTSIPGSYVVTYDVIDTKSKAAAQVTRTVNVTANGAPVISLLGATPVSVAEGATYTDAGATANDVEDGDLTASIVTVNSVDTSVPGAYTVTYNVTDADGKSAVQITRIVNVVANAAPVISLLGTNPVSVTEGATYSDAGATANDAEDGDLTASIVTVNSVDTTVPGVYTVTYNVTDAGGKSAAQVTRTVNVVANAAPVISVLGANPVSVIEGATYTDAGATASDAEDGNLTASIAVVNPVDTSAPG
ncbi:MAG: DUF5011 domain-containing protein, partial [Ectothiorhodospiraceae bacterium]|nr:DUF5011 domain-containing protein [Ectothiorhodospiraceae bacterium]